MNKIGHYINGGFHYDENARQADIYNPATGEVTGQLNLASKNDLNKLVEQSLAVYQSWSKTPITKRAQIMFKMRALIDDKRQDLAKAIAREHGKTVADALGEVQRGLDVVDFACGIPHIMKGEFNDNIGGDIDIFSMREPIGIVAGITPFNFPVMIPIWMGAMAVACGNIFINKPSERDPTAANLLAQLWQEAGLPDGVWNVLHGDKELVDAMLEHPDIPAISFVGSTLVGEYIYQKGASHNKRVQSFCGAKNHLVVMPDADMEQAANALVGSGYGSSGERCMAISVAVPVGEETEERLLESLIPKIENLKMGPWDDENAEINPLITKEAKARVEGLITRGVEEGASLLIDGRGAVMQGYENGFFVGPTLFSKVSNKMDIYNTEIFGPVLSVMSPLTYQQAVDSINHHEYGNGVAIFTRDGDCARDFTRQVDIGMIGVNVPIPVPMAFYSFGGSKRSKFGDTQMYGPESIRFFTKLKTISARWPSGIKEGAQLAFPSS